jgi:hypothetical protein
VACWYHNQQTVLKFPHTICPLVSDYLYGLQGGVSNQHWAATKSRRLLPIFASVGERPGEVLWRKKKP